MLCVTWLRAACGSNGLSRGPRRICDPWTIRRLCPLGAFALAIWPVAATPRRCHISAMHPCGGIADGRIHQFSCRAF
jgi:hypothetical protein